MEKNKKKATGWDARGRANYENISSFRRCSRRVFLYAYGEFNYERDGVMLLRRLRCLRL